MDMPTVPRLLLINPNTTASVTDLVAGYVRKAVGDAVDVAPVTGRFGCSYISSEACQAIAAHAALDCLASAGADFDGVLLACFGDPGLFALREICRVPVTGLAEAAMTASAKRGSFSIVTGGSCWKAMLERLAGELGLQSSLASVRTVSVTGGEIAADPDAALDMLVAACESAASEDGAREVILGGAGLAGLAERIQARCCVPIRDSVLIGAQTALRRMSEPVARASSRSAGVGAIGLSAALANLLV